MSQGITKILSLLISLATMLPADHAVANTLINNSATGVVAGRIVQKGDSKVYVGAITYDRVSVLGVDVSARVDGDIISERGTEINIGSYHGR